MLQEQVCDEHLINSKLRGLNIGEITALDNNSPYMTAETTTTEGVRDDNASDVMSILKNTAQSIEQEHKTLMTILIC